MSDDDEQQQTDPADNGEEPLPPIELKMADGSPMPTPIQNQGR